MSNKGFYILRGRVHDQIDKEMKRGRKGWEDGFWLKKEWINRLQVGKRRAKENLLRLQKQKIVRGFETEDQNKCQNQ